MEKPVPSKTKHTGKSPSLFLGEGPSWAQSSGCLVEQVDRQITACFEDNVGRWSSETSYG